MKKFWGYISAFLAGIIAGLIAMYKIMGDQIEINVKRIKNKRVGSSEVIIPVDVRNPKNGRQNKREVRKSKRVNKRNQIR